MNKYRIEYCEENGIKVKEFNKYNVNNYTNFLEKKLEAINYTRCCETLKDKYEIVFEDWLKDHKFKQSNNGFHKNGIEYKVNEITWMYIQDVYNL